MQPVADLLIDRKRLKTQVMRWRALALLILVAGLGGYASQYTHDGVGGAPIGVDYIARVNLEGIMEDDPDRNDILDDLRDDEKVKAVIVNMDSPGGTTVAGEVTYLKIKAIAAKKPVVGVMNTLCASACYMASMGTSHIIARNGTLTGSIGVLLESIEVSRLADKLGITPITVKSGEMKDAPSFTAPFSPEQRKVVSELVMDAYDQFVGIVALGRKMDEAQVRELADGRAYTGRQALKLKLIDEIGGVEEARDWLEKEKKIGKNLKLHDVKPKPQLDDIWGELGQVTGIKIFSRSATGLDGLVSIWHPPGM